MGIYSFTMPACPPLKAQGKRSLASAMGLDALYLLKNRKMGLFFYTRSF
jgi:NHS family xanthosine MFS transporter